MDFIYFLAWAEWAKTMDRPEDNIEDFSEDPESSSDEAAGRGTLDGIYWDPKNVLVRFSCAALLALIRHTAGHWAQASPTTPGKAEKSSCQS